MAGSAEELHEPVMVDRIVELLGPCLADGGLFVDATLGMGGHCQAVLSAYPAAHGLGLDRDPEALEIATERLAPFGARFSVVQTVFDVFPEFPAGAPGSGSPAPKAFLFDLGVSSLQLDSDSRGFAYSRDTPLDMRMNPADPLTAEDVVNDYTVAELSRLFRQYGEERHSRRIALAIDRCRGEKRISTTHELADIVDAATPRGGRRKGHPAKRVFQAIRIEVNDELGALTRAISAAVSAVDVEGRIAVLSYHSLEDRIVKRAFAEGLNPEIPVGMPVVPEDRKPWLKAVTRGGETPATREAAENPRSRSARLRVVQKIRSWPQQGRAHA